MGYHAVHVLRITDTSLVGGNLVIQWNARPGGDYSVEWSTNLTGWNPIYVGGVGAWTETGVHSQSSKFYRIFEY